MRQLFKLRNLSSGLKALNGSVVRRQTLAEQLQSAISLHSRSRAYRFCTAGQATNEAQPQIQKFDTESMTFKAETKKLLDIVAKSLYTDKDVFLRELLSNASDALEKQRFRRMTGESKTEDELKIQVTLDEAKRVITIFDTGCGMSRDTLIQDLGTIARSGSQAFVSEQKNKADQHNVSDRIIGQFGVGFYSAFIVGETVQVLSKVESSEQAYLWVSDGSGSFEISRVENPGFDRGTKVTIQLRTDCAQFVKKSEIQKVVTRYSNFITFPISINGEQFNLVQAIWTRSKSEIGEDEYKRFWEYIANTKVNYKYRLHYQTDAPLSIKALLYVPSTHGEKYGMMQEEGDVHLYSRKVLIKQRCRELLPNYLRFVKGVVDCEDIPLNISRENYQDTSLIAKLNGILTRRILKMLEEESNKNPQSYLQWYNDFQQFLKEGLATDSVNQDQIMKLCRYNVNYDENLLTVDDYISKMVTGQDKIYYLLAPTREQALISPYYEPFKETDVPVIFLTVHVDEIVFRNLSQHKGFKFVNIENEYDQVTKEVQPRTKTEEQKQSEALNPQTLTQIPEEEITAFCLWCKNELQPTVSKVSVSARLKNSPAVITSQMSTGMRQLLMMMDKQQQDQLQEQNQNLNLEINKSHPLIVKINKVRKHNQIAASLIIRQLVDNCMVTSGMLADNTKFIERINTLMGSVLDNTLEKIALNEMVQGDAFREEARKSANKQEAQEHSEIVLDEHGNAKVVQDKKN